MIKYLMTALFAMISFQTAHAHGLRFEGSTGSNAEVVFKGMMEESKTDSSILVIVGHYGSSVFKEDPISAIRCANQSSTEFSCMVAMKHDRPLDPLEVYPLDDKIDPYGDVKSGAALVAKILRQKAASDASISLLELGTGVEVSRDSKDVNIKCTDAPDGAGVLITTCAYQQ